MIPSHTQEREVYTHHDSPHIQGEVYTQHDSLSLIPRGCIPSMIPSLIPTQGGYPACTPLYIHTQRGYPAYTPLYIHHLGYNLVYAS